MKKIKILHFVTGGFSGATKVVVDLVKAQMLSNEFEPMLVLRRKRSTTTDEQLQKLVEQNITYQTVTGFTHISTVLALRKICLQFKPDILVAHGFPEHILGRYAGLLAKVPHLVHVEHSPKERYTWFKLLQARWLAKRTDKIIGCSKGIAQVLKNYGFPADRITSVSNGIDLSKFKTLEQKTFIEREAALVMVARFARQKDHITLIEALKILKNKGLTPKLRLLGDGRQSHKQAAKNLIKQYHLDEQVEFLGHVGNVPDFLTQHQIFILSTNYEATVLVVLEAMACGCAVIGTDVTGVNELINHKVNGLLAAHKSAQSMADAIEFLLTNPVEAEKLALVGKEFVKNGYSKEENANNYQKIFESIVK